MNNKELLMIYCDMLQGNINRMMVTDDIRDLYKNYVYALRRLQTIFNENEKRLNKEG